MLITDEGTIIRVPVAGINLYSRTASGVIVMRLDGDSSIVNMTRLEKQEEIEEASEAAEAAVIDEALDDEREDAADGEDTGAADSDSEPDGEDEPENGDEDSDGAGEI